jgi:hypothetical protein
MAVIVNEFQISDMYDVTETGEGTSNASQQNQMTPAVIAPMNIEEIRRFYHERNLRIMAH